MDEVMTDNTLALQISTPVISSCDNVDLEIELNQLMTKIL